MSCCSGHSGGIGKDGYDEYDGYDGYGVERTSEGVETERIAKDMSGTGVEKGN